MINVQICYSDCLPYDNWEMPAVPRAGEDLEYEDSGEALTVERVVWLNNGEVWLITDKTHND